MQDYIARYGENKLEGDGSVAWYQILSKRATNAMIVVLVLAMALSYGVEDFIEGGITTAIIVPNIPIGFYQEFKAEKRMDALRSLSAPFTDVVRDGNQATIPSPEVVPGDNVSIKTGETVPADLRLFQVTNLECDEAILTGEALVKETEPAEREDLGLGNSMNNACSLSTIIKGPRSRHCVALSHTLDLEIDLIGALETIQLLNDRLCSLVIPISTKP